MARRIADYVCGVRLEDLDARVVAKAKEQLVYMMGVGFRGLSHPIAPQAIAIATGLSGGQGGATLLAQRTRVKPIEAAFANSSFMRAHGLDDVVFPTAGHAGLHTIPAALALGEELHRSGAEVLAAIITGYEVLGKMATMGGWEMPGPRRGAIPYGTFGVAGVASRLLRLGPAQTANAIGYAADTAMGLGEGHEGQPNHNYGFVNRNGIFGALVAQAGGETADTILEGRFGFYQTFQHQPADEDGIVGRLGHDPEILRATHKRYPGTAMNMVPIALMLELVEARGLRWKDVRRVQLWIPHERTNFFDSYSNGPFPTWTQAVASAPLQLAIILLDGKIDWARYEQRDDPEILALAKRVEIELVPEASNPRWARLAVTTNDGAVHESEKDDHAFGPLDTAAWLTDAGKGHVPDANLARFLTLVRDLERVSDFAELMACMRPDPI